MRRQTFALSWGRKIFFGFGWIFISIMALCYLQTMILPQTTVGWIYYLSTFIGHYGLMTAILYFVFYVPVIWFLPSYYISRFWSLFLILTAGLYVLLDSIVFNQYRYHLNGFIFDLIFSGSSDVVQLPFITYVMLFVGVIVFSLIFWLRGERIWRVMQGRFSNPNKNWYLVIIAFSLILSHSLHIYGKAKGVRSITALAQLFPMHFPASANKFLDGKVEVAQDKSVKRMDDFYYPSKTLECQGEDNKNVLMIVLDGWSEDKIDFFVTPEISHLTKHGINFDNHYSGGLSKQGSLFSLFYSLPATYWAIALDTGKSPVLIDQLQKHQYEMGIFSATSLSDPSIDRTVFSKVSNLNVIQGNQETFLGWKNWIKNYAGSDEEKPFFSFLMLDSNTSSDKSHNDHQLALNQVDAIVGEVVQELYLKKMLSETIIILTANQGKLPSSKTPMIVVWPDKKGSHVNKLTSHYDVVPTLMQELWSCSNKVETYSYGQNLFKPEAKEWLLVADDGEYDILDFNKNLITQINPVGSYSVKNFEMQDQPKVDAREDLIFSVLKDLIRFTKKK